MEKIYRVQMNSKGMPNFSTAVEIDTDLSEYSDKLWKNAYERGKEEEHRWWSEHCAKCTDADRPQGEWIIHFDDIWPEESTIQCSLCREHQPFGIDENFCPNCGCRMKGADDE